MNFTLKTKKLESLVIAKRDIESLIRQNIIKKDRLYYTRDHSEPIIRDIDETIATAHKQLVEVKILIQEANSNEKDEKGNSINYYIYSLSALNSELAVLKDLEYKGETSIKAKAKKISETTDKFKSKLASVKEITKRSKDAAKRREEIEKEKLPIEAILTEFNNRVEREVKVFEVFDSFSTLK